MHRAGQTGLCPQELALFGTCFHWECKGGRGFTPLSNPNSTLVTEELLARSGKLTECILDLGVTMSPPLQTLFSPPLLRPLFCLRSHLSGFSWPSQARVPTLLILSFVNGANTPGHRVTSPFLDMTYISFFHVA